MSLIVPQVRDLQKRPKSAIESGIYDASVELHSNETPSQVLHPHIGYTLRRGLPITLTIRKHKAPENLRNFKENQRGTKKVSLPPYYEGTKEPTNESIRNQYCPQSLRR